jgi:hypothetical protein
MSLYQFEELLENASIYKKEDSLMAKIAML